MYIKYLKRSLKGWHESVVRLLIVRVTYVATCMPRWIAKHVRTDAAGLRVRVVDALRPN